ncbi:MAG TPA: helix-turn-helix domain-containing protein [Bacteroidia bacterium]|nr:helix-turn-helix domain-containing protein [Bacteroidia bacterium]
MFTIITSFKWVVYIGVEQYLISLKIERIKELIILEEFSFSQIAHKLNYSSIAHMSTQFKKVTGLTPSHFKNLKEKRRITIQDL